MADKSRAPVNLAQAAEHVLATPSEHIYIGAEQATPDPSTARVVRDRAELRNGIRRTGIELTVFEEGFLKVVELRGRKRGEAFQLDLHYLDPVPTITRYVAKRSLYAALGGAVAGGVAGFLLRYDALWPWAPVALGLGALAALAALTVAAYRSHERTDFMTIHGRAPVLSLVANFGSLKRFRAFVPVLSRAIDDAAERIGDDTSAYLRAEMREHYRLRGDGVLSGESCSESTGRILAQFDVQL